MAAGDRRGQTSFDFAVGMGVFLLTVGFALTFIPGIFAPFSVGSGGDEVVADRVGATVVEDLLVAEPGDRSTLDADCVVEFFDGDGPAGTTDCRFATDDLDDTIGVSTSGLNLTLRRGGRPASLDGTTLVAGDAVPDDADVTASQRLVSVDGRLYELVVRVW